MKRLIDEVGHRAAPPAEIRKAQRRMTIERDVLAARDAGDERIPICISSEEPYERWWGIEILGHGPDEIDMQYCEQGLAFCADHDVTRQIGIVEDIAVGKDGKLRGMVRMGAHPDADWIKKDILAGIRWGISVGYSIDELELVEAEGDPDGDGDMEATYRVTKWTPLEASTVAAPADTTVGVGRSATQGARSSAQRVPGAARNGQGDGNMGTTVREPAGAAAEPTPEQIREQVRKEERERTDTIRTLCRENDMEADYAAVSDLSVADASKRLLELQRERRGTQPVIRVGAPREGDKPFRSLGDFLGSVIRSAREHRVDPRLMVRASGMSEGVPADGGFAVPPEFADGILTNVWQTGEVLKRVDRRPMSSSRLVVNRLKEDSRATGSRYGGIQTYWAGEGVAGTPKKPALRQIELTLQKLIGLWYLTDELVEDAPALQAEAENAFQQEIRFAAEDSVINGVGNGQPLGILNSGAVVQIAIESGQTLANSAQYISKNVAKMYAAMPPWLLPDSVWLVNYADLMPTLINSTVGGANAQVPVFMPPGALSAAPFGTILGRPIIPVEYCAAGGTPGDIIFANLSQVLVGERGGIKTAQSMHVQFTTDEQCFRITYRLDAQPVWVNSVTQYKSTQALSPYITLATRS